MITALLAALAVAPVTAVAVMFRPHVRDYIRAYRTPEHRET